jgi:hypothetical protein
MHGEYNVTLDDVTVTTKLKIIIAICVAGTDEIEM